MMATILVADDSAFQRKNIRYMLAQDGYTIIEARSGQEALELVAAQPPDCILLDIIMPGRDGLEVLEALRERTPAIPVIMITADIQESTRQQCLALGAVAVVNKPQSAEDLRKIINQTLAGVG